MGRPILEYITPKLLERFWSKVDKRGPDDCWEWTGGRDVAGYGQLSLGGTSPKGHPLHCRASRISQVIATGVEIPEGLLVLHSCDNPPCVNPAHLSVGTHAENCRQRIDRGRSRLVSSTGENSTSAKIPNSRILPLLVEHCRGNVSGRQISKRLRASETAVFSWVNGRKRPDLIEKAVWLA